MEQERGMMTNEQRQKEIREAVQAGEEAYAALESALTYLKSAGSWGIFDMFAGGLVSSMVKHSKLDSAEEEIERAKRKLAVFQRELGDVSSAPGFTVEVGGFIKFVDIFMDNLWVDWAVQSKISKARTQVEGAMSEVRGILTQLRAM